jgi:hypothetical protein
MASVLVIHESLDTKGGGEAVCMHVLEALQDDHEVTLLTDSRVDLQELDRYYGTTVSDVRIRTSPLLRLGTSFARLRLAKLERSVLSRAVDDVGGKYDLLISTNRTAPRLPVIRCCTFTILASFDEPRIVMRGRPSCVGRTHGSVGW